MNTTGGSHSTASRPERQAPYEIAYVESQHGTEEPRTGTLTLQSMRVTVRDGFLGLQWEAIG